MKKLDLLNISFLIGVFICTTIYSIDSYCQETTTHIANKYKDYIQGVPIEKIYVHTDKSFYVTGEILWFKIYQLDGVKQKPFNFSKSCFIELIDAHNKPVWQSLIDLTENSGGGSYMLPSSINTGNYTLRCYTNWMQNFSEEYFFEKKITVINPLKQTGGEIFNNNSENHITFFPEGGHLVSGLKSKMGFKIINSNGKSLNAKGFILNSENDTITKFETFKFGMGHFYFTPKTSESYRALLNFEDGTSKSFALPEINKSGIVAGLNDINSETIKITVTNSSVNNELVYLFIHGRQNTPELQQQIFDNGKTEFTLLKNKLEEGINYFTIFNHLQQPVWERLYFVHPQSKLDINLKAVSKNYNRREEVIVDIETFAGTIATPAELSMAVSLSDSFQNEDPESIFTYLWLSSELKGKIESPQFYFSSEDGVEQALENLLITQGWRRFNWQHVIQNDKSPFKYLPEYEAPIITAKTIDKTTGLPVANKVAYLSFPGEHFRLSQSASNESGIINFIPQKYFGSADMILQAVDNNIRIDLQNTFSQRNKNNYQPALQFNETLKEQLIRYSISSQTLSYFQKPYLNRFTIPETYDTSAFYGKPDNTYLLDNYTRFTTLEEVLREIVPEVRVRKYGDAFRFHVLNTPYKNYFESDPLILLDGVPVKTADQILNYDPLKIRKLDVVARKFFYHSAVYNGIVSFTTYDGNLPGFTINPDAIVINYKMLQLQREFYSPVYETIEQKQTRIPDQRNVLLWKPDIKTENGNTKIRFFTSDMPGKYLIIINGITKEGVAGSAKFSLEVK